MFSKMGMISDKANGVFAMIRLSEPSSRLRVLIKPSGHRIVIGQRENMVHAGNADPGGSCHG